MLISVFGTLVTDNMSDNLHIPLEFSTVFFTIVLAITFGVWYAAEKTLSIHSIFTKRREAFYWLTILFTFALGTAAGDLMAEGLGLGYATTGIIIAALIAIFAVGWRMGLNAIISFWFIYILTRPLGASIGDFLTQSPANGGLGLGATTTTIIFTLGIILSVAYLTFSRKDVVQNPVDEEREDSAKSKYAIVQLAVIIVLLLAGSLGGYYWRHQQLQAPAAATTSSNGSAPALLGDLSTFTTTAQSMLTAVQAGNWAQANKGANDLEYAWDTDEARLKPMNPTAWTHVDGALDKVFREIRAVNPNKQTAAASLEQLLAILKNP